jgi:hypothetical protein
MTKPPAAERPRLTLEDYILFFTTHSGSGLTIDLLNQVRTQNPLLPPYLSLRRPPDSSCSRRRSSSCTASASPNPTRYPSLLSWGKMMNDSLSMA